MNHYWLVYEGIDSHLLWVLLRYWFVFTVSYEFNLFPEHCFLSILNFNIHIELPLFISSFGFAVQGVHADLHLHYIRSKMQRACWGKTSQERSVSVLPSSPEVKALQSHSYKHLIIHHHHYHLPVNYRLERWNINANYATWIMDSCVFCVVYFMCEMYFELLNIF